MNKFPKSERLSQKSSINELFQRGKSFTDYPLKVIYLKRSKEDFGEMPHQILVTVPKKNFKRAVDRNKLKRRIREAYRLNKELLDSTDPAYYLVIGYIYLGNNVAAFQIIEDKLKTTLLRLREVVRS